MRPLPEVSSDTPALPRYTRTLILLGVFLCAACGLVYELALVALGSYLLGNTVTQASVVLSVMVFAMGVGALVAKRLARRPARNFAVVELALGLIGGTSVMTLYAAFAWWSLYQPLLVILAFVIGLLIGAEIPLLMEMMQRVRSQHATSAVADLFAYDYVGALLGGLAFPFVLLPTLGLLRGTMAIGALNAAVGAGTSLVLFRAQLTRVARVGLAAALVVILGTLGGLAAWANSFELSAQQRIYRDPIASTTRSPYQDIVVTRSLDGQDTRLFLNGDLQFSTRDEYRYHEALVAPVMNGPRGRVLILGGGDGLAAARVLTYPGVTGVTLVDLDPAVVKLARTFEPIKAANHGAMADKRVNYVAADAFSWLRANKEKFDAVIVDFPDADDTATAKLYSAEIYGLIRRALTPDGRVVVQCGSPYFAQRYFWTCASTLRQAGFAATPYHVDVPSFGDWGFYLARPGEGAPRVMMPADAPRQKFVSPAVLAAALVFPPDRARVPMPPSTLLNPRILDAAKGSYAGY